MIRTPGVGRCRMRGVLRVVGLVAGFVICFGSLTMFQSAANAAPATAQAIPGRPFGFGIVNIPLIPGSDDAFLTNGLLLQEDDRRVFYSVVSRGRPIRLLDILRPDRDAVPDEISILFLFRGDEPLHLTVFTPTGARLVVTPTPVALPQASRTWNRWWTEYLSAAKRQMDHGDYPPIVETYLTSMLARRLTLPSLDPPKAEPVGELQRTFELMTGSEKMHVDLLRQITLARDAAWPPANIPMPREIAWRSAPLPPIANEPEIESIAQHVPDNCFYLRFGNFGNFLWLDRLTAEHGGDLERMITLRGFRADHSIRIQQQMGTEPSGAAAAFGDQFVADLALIGRDMLVSDGAAVGVIIEAKSDLLSFGINHQRAGAAAKEKANGGKLETIKILDRDVSFLSTPDGRLRSYYVVDGKYHLMTTCRDIVEGFIRAGQGNRPLANLPAFRHARTLMPTSREDTIFVFLSPDFLQELAGPAYQIEVLRRQRSLAELELLQLAHQTAKHEQLPHDTVADLIQSQLLPPGFGERSDGSQLQLDGDRVVDALRGARGYFKPIPDMTVSFATAPEFDSFAKQASFFQEKWREMDPVMIGLKRYALPESNRERLVVEGNISPLVEKKYGRILEMIGTPVAERIRPLGDDAIWVQAALSGNGLFGGNGTPHHVFLGVQDASPLSDVPANGLLQKFRLVRTTPAYFGAWPQPGLLDRLPFGLAGRPDAAGFSRFPLGVWRRQVDGFSVLSFDPKLLADVTTRLRPELTEDPAQIRVHIGDLAETKLASLVNEETFNRALNTSVGNVKFLHTLSQQLGVERSECLSEAQRLLNVQLVCSLGGKYELYDVPQGVSLWRSDRWPALVGRGVPSDFQAPLLTWFRGLDASVTKYGDRIFVKAHVDIERRVSEPKVELPLFDLLSGSLFGGKGDIQKDDAPKKRLRNF